MQRFNSSKTKPKELEVKKAIVVLWDDDIKEHREINSHLTNMLSTQYELTIINYPEYLRSLATIRDNINRKEGSTKNRLFIKISHKILAAVRENKNIRKAFGKSVIIRNSSSKNWPTECNLANKLLVSKKAESMSAKQRSTIETRWKRIREANLSRHAIVDLSLHAKIQEDQLEETNNIVVKQIRQNLRRHSLILSGLIKKAIGTSQPSEWIVFSNAVYSLDWATREIAHEIGCDHRFIESSPLSREDNLRIKVYSSYPEDLYIRRKLQEDIKITNKQAREVTNYALFYLQHRLQGNTSHTFSPLNGHVTAFREILNMLDEKKQKIWTYFSNSPDELACIDHAINESGTKAKFKTIENGAAQTEEEAIRLLAEIAEQHQAILVIRLHPRLGKSGGTKGKSSALRVMLGACESVRSINEASVKIIGPDEQVNSYMLCLLSDHVISFRGTMPVEANLLGITPIVLAVDKGFSNYWIRSHAERAPKGKEELEMLLDDTKEREEGLLKFLAEFWYINRLGEISLRDKASWDKFKIAINQPEKYYTEEIAKLNDRGKDLSTGEIKSLSDAYLSQCRHLIEKIFFRENH